MQQNEKVFGVQPQIISVPAGLTVPVYIPAIVNQVSVQMRVITGSSTIILAASNGQTYVSAQPFAGSTLAGATLFAISATFSYQLGASGTESVVELQGPAAFYLASPGAATVHLLRKLSQQTPNV